MIIDPYTWQKSQIIKLTKLTNELVSVTMKKPQDYTYRAGQYAIFRLQVNGIGVIRQYSFISAPAYDHIELLVQLEVGGVASHWFFDEARDGDELEVSQAFGNFTVQDKSQPLLLIGGRVGIAPFISILRDDNLLKQVTLYAVRNESELCYRSLLDEHGAFYFASSADERIDEKTLVPYLKNNPLIYLCGSKRFVDDIFLKLKNLGIPTNQIKRESFTI